jgi:competence protein ComFC
MVNVLPPAAKLKRIALDLLFPRYCVNCGREGDFICEKCRRLLSFIISPVCDKCGRPLSEGTVCNRCIEEQTVIDGIRAPFAFEGLVRQAVHQLKYQNLRALAETFAEYMNKCFEDNISSADVLVPVPLHAKRLRERGYNQSALLAHEIGRLCGLPVIDSALVRRLHTPPQAQSSGIEERRHNLADAFCLNSGFHGKHVLLIDDVATSGSTLNTCARELKAGGAASVWGLVIALEL